MGGPHLESYYQEDRPNWTEVCCGWYGTIDFDIGRDCAKVERYSFPGACSTRVRLLGRFPNRLSPNTNALQVLKGELFLRVLRGVAEFTCGTTPRGNFW